MKYISSNRKRFICEKLNQRTRRMKRTRVNGKRDITLASSITVQLSGANLLCFQVSLVMQSPPTLRLVISDFVQARWIASLPSLQSGNPRKLIRRFSDSYQPIRGRTSHHHVKLLSNVLSRRELQAQCCVRPDCIISTDQTTCASSCLRWRIFKLLSAKLWSNTFYLH